MSHSTFNFDTPVMSCNFEATDTYMPDDHTKVVYVICNVSHGIVEVF